MNRTLKVEFVKACRDGKLYDFLASQYWRLDKEDLKDIAKEAVFAYLTDGEKRDHEKCIRVAEGMQDYNGWEDIDLGYDFQKCDFVPDGESDMSFSGWTDGRDWNGYAVPFFEKTEALKIASELSDDIHCSIEYHKDGDKFVVKSKEDSDESECVGRDIDTADGKKHVYQLAPGLIECWFVKDDDE
jgi:hypothetical protein